MNGLKKMKKTDRDLFLYGQSIRYRLFGLFWIRLNPLKVLIERAKPSTQPSGMLPTDTYKTLGKIMEIEKYNKEFHK